MEIIITQITADVNTGLLHKKPVNIKLEAKNEIEMQKNLNKLRADLKLRFGQNVKIYFRYDER